MIWVVLGMTSAVVLLIGVAVGLWSLLFALRWRPK